MRYALIGMVVLMLGGAAHAERYASSFGCAPVCLTGSPFGDPECAYYTYEQCYASQSGLTGGACIPNPFVKSCGLLPPAHATRHRKQR